MNQFTFQKQCSLSQLKTEIEASPILYAIQNIESNNDTVIVTFKGNLSQDDANTLTNVVNNHVPDWSPDSSKVELASPKTTEDGIPYVYSSSRPMGHYTCFQGSSDSETRIGGGTKCVFKLNSKTPSISKDFTFNEGVYLKDGYMITRNAPMGATIDVDIVHPDIGAIVGTFCRAVPVYGTGWFPMDTESAGYLPKGFILRITVNNSQGGEEGHEDEDYPADFYLSGRFELYRKEWKYDPSNMFNR